MQLNTELTQQDIENYRAFRAVVSQGKFEIQGAAVTKIAALMAWYAQLEKKLEEALKKQKLEASKKAAKKSIKELEAKK